MTGAVIVLMLSSLRAGILTGLLALLCAILLALQAAGISPGPGQIAVIFLMALAAPLSALATGLILDHRIVGAPARPPAVFSQFSVLAGIVIFLSSAQLVDYLERVVAAVQGSEVVRLGLLAGSAISSGVFCSGASIIALLLFAVLIELPIRWLSTAGGFKAVVPYRSLRLAALICGVALSFNLVVSLFERELSIGKLLGL